MLAWLTPLLLGAVLAAQVLLVREVENSERRMMAKMDALDAKISDIKRETRLTTAYLQDYENQQALRGDE